MHINYFSGKKQENNVSVHKGVIIHLGRKRRHICQIHRNDLVGCEMCQTGELMYMGEHGANDQVTTTFPSSRLMNLMRHKNTPLMRFSIEKEHVVPSTSSLWSPKATRQDQTCESARRKFKRTSASG